MKSNKIVGIPKGLFYSKYHLFAENFFENLGFQTITSPDTNRQILNEGVQCCVDDACLPVKIFHGHVGYLKNQCDYLLMPHLLSFEKGQTFCPILCGLVEMVKSSIPHLPRLIDTPIFSLDEKHLKRWAHKAGRASAMNPRAIDQALSFALSKQKPLGIYDEGYEYRVALIGHAYIVYDTFVNMNIIRKLNKLGIGVVTSDSVDRTEMMAETSNLFKQPFWYFATDYYGAAISLYKRGIVDGIIYLSAFSCGIDSVMTEFVKQDIGSLACMVIKLDEHTGEAAFDTRIEAFSDMLKRRKSHGCHLSAYGQHISCGQSVF